MYLLWKPIVYMEFKPGVLSLSFAGSATVDVEDAANTSKRGSFADWQLLLCLLLPPGALYLCSAC